MGLQATEKNIEFGRDILPNAELINIEIREGVTLLTYLIAATLILATDRFSKFLIMRNMAEGQSIPLIPPFLYITYVQNRGAAFGFLQGQMFLLSAIAVVCLLFVFTQWNKIMSKSIVVRWGVVIALAGAIGNLIDRLRWGAVIDFLDIRIFVFNIADVAIVFGVALLFWEVLVNDPKRG